MFKKLMLGILGSVFLVLGCTVDVPSSTPEPTVTPTSTTAPVDPLPAPTSTPMPDPMPSPTPTPSPTVTPLPTSTPAATPTPTPTLEVSEEIQTIVISTIMGNPEVLDAAISQDGRTLSLVLIVGSATNKEYSKQLGDNFVRMVKSFSQDDPPGKTIGKGMFNYLVGVYYPSGDLVVQGAKVTIADRITW